MWPATTSSGTCPSSLSTSSWPPSSLSSSSLKASSSHFKSLTRLICRVGLHFPANSPFMISSLFCSLLYWTRQYLKRIGPHAFLLATPAGVDDSLYLPWSLDFKTFENCDGGSRPASISRWKPKEMKNWWTANSPLTLELANHLSWKETDDIKIETDAESHSR